MTAPESGALPAGQAPDPRRDGVRPLRRVARLRGRLAGREPTGPGGHRADGRLRRGDQPDQGRLRRDPDLDPQRRPAGGHLRHARRAGAPAGRSSGWAPGGSRSAPRSASTAASRCGPCGRSSRPPAGCWPWSGSPTTASSCSWTTSRSTSSTATAPRSTCRSTSGRPGMQMMELAGDIGDGVVLNYMVGPDYNKRRHGGAGGGCGTGRADRSSDLDRPQLVVCSVDEDRDLALDRSRELLTQYLGQQPHIMKASGVDPALIAAIGKILTWPAGPEEIRKAMGLVPDDAVQMITASGTPGRVPGQGRRVRRGGSHVPHPLPARRRRPPDDRHVHPEGRRAVRSFFGTGHPVPQGHGARRVLPDLRGGRRARPSRRERRNTDLLKDKTLLTAFYQPSTRTRLATEAAMHRLGGHVLGFSDAKMTRAGDFYQETIKDTVHMLEYYGDVIAMRHFQQGAPAEAARVGVRAGHQLRRRLGRAPDPGADRPLHDLAGQGHARRPQGAVRRRHADADDALDPLRHVPVRHGGVSSSSPPEMSLLAEFKAELDERNVDYREVGERARRASPRPTSSTWSRSSRPTTPSRASRPARRARPHARPPTGSPASCCGRRPRATRSSCTRSRAWTSCPPDVDSTRHARYWVGGLQRRRHADGAARPRPRRGRVARGEDRCRRTFAAATSSTLRSGPRTRSRRVLEVAVRAQAGAGARQPATRYLRDKVLAMLFFFASTRTRASFEAGMAQLGGHAQFIESRTTQIAHGDTPKEIGEILGRYNDGIAIRHVDWGVGNAYIRDVAAASRVPVLNMQCDVYHPHQALADLMTIIEGSATCGAGRSPSAGRTRRATRSRSACRRAWCCCCPRFGMNVRLVHPPEFRLMPEVVEQAQENARRGRRLPSRSWTTSTRASGAPTSSTPRAGARCSTTTDEAEGAAIGEQYTDWITDERRMATATEDAIYMHPLPADRDVEVADEVIDGPQSVVYDEAENRLHVQKAVMALHDELSGGRAVHMVEGREQAQSSPSAATRSSRTGHQTSPTSTRPPGETCRHVVGHDRDGWDVVITHGNGPQVGFILRRSELAARRAARGAARRLRRGHAGRHRLRAAAEPQQRVPPRAASTGTPPRSSRQTQVAARRPGLPEPEQADRLVHGRGRRPSRRRDARLGRRRGRQPGLAPRRRLAPAAAASSRSTPSRRWSRRTSSSSRSAAAAFPSCAATTASLQGVAAVIDKDLASALLATRARSRPAAHHDGRREGGAELRRSPEQRWVDHADARGGPRRYLAEGTHFAKGSMAPKIQAVIKYLERGGKEAIITDPENRAGPSAARRARGSPETEPPYSGASAASLVAHFPITGPPFAQAAGTFGPGRGDGQAAKVGNGPPRGANDPPRGDLGCNSSSRRPGTRPWRPGRRSPAGSR